MNHNQVKIRLVFNSKDSPESEKFDIQVLGNTRLEDLLEGIYYGLQRQIKNAKDKSQVDFERCLRVFNDMYINLQAGQKKNNPNLIIDKLSVSSHIAIKRSDTRDDSAKHVFLFCDLDKPICDLGFVNSTRLIFSPHDMDGVIIDPQDIIPAFSHHYDKENIIEGQYERVSFPEYNISTRQLTPFDDTPVKIIPPSDPPEKPKMNLVATIIPGLISAIIMAAMRSRLTSGDPNMRISMIVFSLAMVVTTIVSSIISMIINQYQYKKDLSDWREHYIAYIRRKIKEISDRAQKDRKALQTEYPDIMKVLRDDMMHLDRRLYERSPRDDDFLSVRLGMSDHVETMFEIVGEKNDTIFSKAMYFMEVVPKTNGAPEIMLDIYARSEGRDNQTNHGALPKNLCELPGEVAEIFKFLKDAPLMLSIKKIGALGIYRSDYQYDLSSNKAEDHYSHDIVFFIDQMIMDMCFFQSPDTVQFVMFVPSFSNLDIKDRLKQQAAFVKDFAFLPHFSGLLKDRSQFVNDKESAHLVMSSLLNILTSRKESGIENIPHIVMVIYEEYGLKEHAFAQFLPSIPEIGKPYTNELGITFVFASRFREYLPAYCNNLIVINNEGEADLYARNGIPSKKTFRLPCHNERSLVRDDVMSNASRFLSVLYYTRIAENGKVPPLVQMFELIEGTNIVDKSNIRGVIEHIIEENWADNGKTGKYDITKTLAVPVGKNETKMTYLDLHETKDGPHMLVAGTTGSGKSETVISYLLGLCMRYGPQELNLLLVDMKGGGFTKRLGRLPHIVGTITDVDGDENGTDAVYMLNRFLVAVKAEIKTRKLLFNKMKVDSIDAYIKACRNIDDYIKNGNFSDKELEQIREAASQPLSHLVFVVDEFTELKRFSNENDKVDFIGEITTIARIGRSLGFHIILISQNIEGAITDDIRVNSNARLCLRVATRQASKDMIGNELAASSSMGIGRAYLLVGTDTKFEYFQSGYSGASVNAEIDMSFELVNRYGMFETFYSSREDKKSADNEMTQLKVIVDAICKVDENRRTKNGENLDEPRRTPRVVFQQPLPQWVALDKHHKRHNLQ